MSRKNFFKNNSNGTDLPALNSNKNIVSLVYIIQFLSLFTAGTLLLVPLFMNYIFRHRTRYTWLDSHFRWQIQTFWFATLFYIIAIVFGVIPFLGWIISAPCFVIATLIIIFRTYKGWTTLSKELPALPENETT
ncbi:DUF4870 family protein [Fluviispira sanaruensis]|uniref:Transmembrane protein n=1 Tax=Fluviispira sanaruensis TaxID=2493639 RepID=A0A4P2VGS5_FLUSA|nr:hypothetical protein [Fluviispira sanaruensis]BBH51851.1 hypothetical protein JCM31447_02740 [Fluviispira sanaruensis]